MNRFLAIVGPTGAGKSNLALHLAQKFHGEIINADSRQVYRHLDIGTAKPSAQERATVPHHLYDIINPDASFSLSQYQELAYHVIDEVQARERLPMLVGGSGQYVWGVLEGWQAPKVPPDKKLRESLEKIPTAELYQELLSIDSAAARKIDKRNVRRIIRAIEVYKQTGKPFSHLRQKTPPAYSSFIIGLTMERKELYRRLDRRVDEMIARGLVAEVENLFKASYHLDLPSLSSIGYKQIGAFLKRENTLAEAIQKIKYETHRFVRQQYTWFRLADNRIHWFDAERQTYSAIEATLNEFLGNKSAVDP
ncbi:MAG: tRNA (adenosine(37)-N6)-dimethylallyltransferase MiaA [Dehalococcoidales bacterium]|nr:tRNA (adenosine(37)-N6)-dimethylallyltransferase MiaA [Dehalococcoidales bacterium]